MRNAVFAVFEVRAKVTEFTAAAVPTLSVTCAVNSNGSEVSVREYAPLYPLEYEVAMIIYVPVCCRVKSPGAPTLHGVLQGMRELVVVSNTMSSFFATSVPSGPYR